MKTADAATERKLLITALQHRSDRARNYILANCQHEDFGTEEGQEIRARMTALLKFGKELGDVAIFGADPTLSKEAKEFLKCSRNTKTKAAKIPRRHIDRMLQIVQDFRKIRSLYDGAKAITELCTGQYQESTISKAESVLLDVVKQLRENREKSVTHFGRNRSEEEVKQWLRQMMKKRKDQFIRTGLTHLDKHLTGWRRGDLVVISAPRGGGKTAMILQMMVEQFRSGYNVGLASLEMDEEQLMERMIANVTNTRANNVRRRDFGDKEDRRSVWEQWKQFELETSQKHGNFFSPWELKDSDYRPENLELDMGPFGYDIIYVDYLSLFSSGKQEMWKAQKEHSRYLKQMAKRLNPRPVIVLLTQLSKDERTKYGTGPEEDADYWMWWRFGEEEQETGKVELRLGKARHARGGVIPAKFDLARMQIRTTGGVQTGMSSYVENRNKRKGKSKKGGKPSADFDNPLLDVDLDGEEAARGY